MIGGPHDAPASSRWTHGVEIHDFALGIVPAGALEPNLVHCKAEREKPVGPAVRGIIHCRCQAERAGSFSPAAQLKGGLPRGIAFQFYLHFAFLNQLDSTRLRANRGLGGWFGTVY